MAFTDLFNGTPNTPLTTHSASWLIPSGGTSLEISSDGVSAQGNADSMHANYWDATFASAHYSKIIIAASTGTLTGPAIRIQSGSNEYYYALWLSSDSEVVAGQFVSGVATDWDSGHTFAVGDTVEFAIDLSVTTTVYLKRNGSTVATYTNKNALSGGRSGVCALFAPSNTGAIASWEGGDVEAPPSGVVVPSRLNAGINSWINPGTK